MPTVRICTIGNQVLAYAEPERQTPALNRVFADNDRRAALLAGHAIVPFAGNRTCHGAYS